MSQEHKAYPPKVEIQEKERNGLVEFLVSTSVVGDFCETRADIQQEINGTFTSKSFYEIIDASLMESLRDNSARLNTSSSATIPARKMRQNRVFKKIDTDPKDTIERNFFNPIYAQNDIFLFKVPDEDASKKDVEFGNMLGSSHQEALRQFRGDFFESIGPLVEHYRDAGAQALEAFSQHFQISPRETLEGLADLLADEKYAPLRREFQPFLTLLQAALGQEGNKSFLHQQLKQQKDHAIAMGPTDIILVHSFIATTLKEEKSDTRVSRILGFAQEVANQIADSQNFDLTPQMLTKIFAASYHQWPPELRFEFEKFIGDKFKDLSQTIIKGLSQFQEKKPRPQKEIFLQKKKKNGGGTPSHIAAEQEDSVIETSPTQPHAGIALLSSLAPVEAHLDSRVKKLGGDAYLLTDAQNALESLQEDPYGSGTKNIRVSRVTLRSGKKARLRTFAPKSRRSLHLNNPMWYDLRFLYAVASTDENITIFLDGPYHHDEYMQKIKLYLGS